MNLQTIKTYLEQEGIKEEDIQIRTGSPGLRVGIPFKAFPSKSVFSLVPIDDKHDIAFARFLLKESRSRTVEEIHNMEKRK